MIEFPSAVQLQKLLADEIRQRREEGCEVDDADARRTAAGDDRAALLAHYHDLCQLTPVDSFAFYEPSDLSGIQAALPADGRVNVRPNLGDSISDRIHGGWLGRCAGCALGKPLELPPFMKSGRNVRRYLEAAGAYPLSEYVLEDRAACKAVGLEALICPASQRATIQYMESDDDLRYTIMGLDMLERRGAKFATRDVAAWWLNQLPAAKCYTAEQAAYRNLILLDRTHDAETLSDEQLESVRSYLNPYREWIGAQIRADGWGLACPGNPAMAAEFAWRDATLSHAKNGIYGEMFCAAMIAAALVLDDPLAIVRAGLAEIPANCRLADAIERTISRCESLDFDAERFELALEWLWETFGDLDPVHTINNAAAVATALLLGGAEYESVITIAVMCGWDTDCNGATAGCIVGAMLGAERLPGKWTEPLNDTLLSEVPGFHPIKISACAARHTAVARKLAG